MRSNCRFMGCLLHKEKREWKWEKRGKGEGKKKATAAGFELARAEPNRFRVCLLNHSDKLSCCWCSLYPS